MNVILTGGSGLVGRRLTPMLQEKGHQVAWLSRSARSGETRTFQWNISKQEIDPEALIWADAIIHLAGAGVADKRWTASRKREIHDSRTESTRLLVDALRSSQAKLQRFVSASAIGYYGFQTSEHIYTETDPPGTDFLAQVTVDWEREVAVLESLDISSAWARIGIVLAREGGAVPEMLKQPVLSPLGTGKHWMPWIHVDDLCALFIHLLEDPSLKGAYNAVAPNPEQNNTFTKALAKYGGKVSVPIPAPSWVLSLVVGEMAQMLVNGSRISCSKIQESGFAFSYASLEKALQSLFSDRA